MLLGEKHGWSKWQQLSREFMMSKNDIIYSQLLVLVVFFNLVFTLCTFYDCCNASRSAFLYRGALNTLIVLYL